MQKWQILDVPCVVILATENHPLNCTTSDEQENEVMPQLSPSALNTIEEIQEFTAWEEKPLKENTK